MYNDVCSTLQILNCSSRGPSQGRLLKWAAEVRKPVRALQPRHAYACNATGSTVIGLEIFMHRCGLVVRTSAHVLHAASVVALAS